MRIKKITETAPTQASVVGTYNNSQTDSYSCKYVNELLPVVLWESTNTTLNEGLIELPIDEYNYVEIMFYTETAAASWKYLKSTGKVPVIASARGTMGDYVSEGSNSSAPQYFGRNYTFTIPSTGTIGISFTNGYNYNGSTYSNRNSSGVPIKIVGYK